jgi:hypothetical protein
MVIIEAILTLCLSTGFCEPALEDTFTHYAGLQEVAMLRGQSEGVRYGTEQWRPIVAVYFKPGDVDRALCLMEHESGGDPQAKNPNSSARGLMQVMASIWAPHFGVSYDDLYDPHTNLYIAARIKDIQGWQAWSPYNRGLCHD